MSKFVSIQEAAKFLGVSTQTLRRWEREGKEIAVERTKGDQRRYDLSKMLPLATRLRQAVQRYYSCLRQSIWP